MSSPTGTPNSKGSNALTHRDVELLGFAMQSMKDTNVQIDYDKFAELAGLTGGSARTIWGKLRRKLVAASNVDGTPVSESSQAAKPKAKKRGRKRKTEDADNGDTITEPQSPTTMASDRPKKRAKKSAKTDVQDQGSENEGDVDAQVKGEDGATIKPEV